MLGILNRAYKQSQKLLCEVSNVYKKKQQKKATSEKMHSIPDNASWLHIWIDRF